MNIIVHILSVLALGRFIGLNREEWILAFVFGVLIDVDHLIKLPLYIKLKNFQTMRHLNWRTNLQEPISLLWVVPISIFFKSYIPLMFFAVHVALDYMMSYIKKPLFPFFDFIVKDTKKFKRDCVLQIVVGLICIIILII